MKKVIGKFQVEYLQILDENGKCDEKSKPKLSDLDLKKIYDSMVLTRVFDDKALKLQRQGRLGTYAPMRGQEACQIASGFAMKKEDWVFPAFRENGLYIMRGVPPEMLYRYWLGDERGMKIPEGIQMFPISITVGAHMIHAVGAAMAFNIKKEKKVAITYFGDGATSEGDFHTAMNFAGTFRTPTVFICQNNQWAISVPVKEQTRAETLAQKAIAYGFPGIKVDGNDVFAVYKATKDAIDKARKGEGPTLIECFTYRLADHTTSDDAKKYRSEDEVKKWEKKDPILRFEKYLLGEKIINKKYVEDIKEKSIKEIESAVLKSEGTKMYSPEEMFEYMYKEKTPDLVEQQALAVKEVKEHAETSNPEKGEKTVAKEKGFGVVGELEEAK
jgi:pyruvate dehydrogenase E1 component alpha subunit